MTTIAATATHMASDSWQLGEYIDGVECQKLWRINDDLFGCSGDYASCLKFVEWVLNGQHIEERPENMSDTFAALHLKRIGDKTICYHYGTECIPIECGVPAAIGSGARIAIGALMAGATAHQAIEITKKLDTSTGGRTVTLKLDEGVDY
jgi:hypothetical protein